MATMDPGQRGFGQQRQFNIPDLPFKDLGRQGPAGAGNAPFINQMQRLFPQGQMPPELLELLMAQLFGGQGGGRPPVIKIEDLVRALSGGGGQRQAPQANMPVPQARR